MNDERANDEVGTMNDEVEAGCLHFRVHRSSFIVPTSSFRFAALSLSQSVGLCFRMSGASGAARVLPRITAGAPRDSSAVTNLSGEFNAP
jgi:hypothetical protein